MRKRLAWLSVPLACAIVIAACGSSSDGGDDSNGIDSDGGGSDGTISRGDGSAVGDGASDATVPFSPADFGSRLVLWLDASELVTTADAGVDASPIVAGWGDRSSAHNDAKPYLGLTFDLGSDTDAAVNGLPVVRFSGNSSLAIPQTASLVWGTGDFSLYVVFRARNSSATFGLVAGKYDTAAPYPGPNVYVNFFMPLPSTNIAGRLDSTHYAETTDGGFNDDAMRVVGMRRGGARVELRVDGVSSINEEAGLPDGAAIDVSAPDASFYIGGRPNPGAYLDGDVAEVIGVQGTLSDAEIEELEAYLKSKYAL